MIYIGIGSNLGDREQNIRRAVDMLGRVPGLSVRAVSANYETEPQGGPSEQPLFLNAAVALEGKVLPHPLLDLLKMIEHALGRDLDGERWGPRPIDLDILLIGDRVIDEPNLTVPHPRMRERLFVLEPLCEIAPYATHPLCKRSVMKLLDMQRKSECEL
jgi:2-amino-4-hydroxy-6-hydroxymethyldihydropteridine diphosphokinase